MSLNRSDTILKYIVEYFIKNAQPVGSQTLIDEYKLPYSSATIRNEMVVLEKLGFLEKTHTSSGRVPSTKGYKYYCEHLRDKSIDEELKNSLQTVLSGKVQSIENVIKASCEVVSHMTNLVSVVSRSEDEFECLASVQLIPISNNTFTAIFVTDTGYVENKTFLVPENMSVDEVSKCVTLLNDRLKGTPVKDLVEKMESLKPVLNDYIISHDLVYQALLETFLRFASDRLSLYGREELFNHPEFVNDKDKLLAVMKLLDDTSVFKEVKEEVGEDIQVNIGDIEGNPDVSLVTAKLSLGQDGETTSISLIGPKRMDYDKALSALECLKEELDKYFNELNKGGNTNGGKDA